MTNCIHEWEFSDEEWRQLICPKCGKKLDGHDLVNHMNVLESDLANTRNLYASLQSRLAEFEEGFDPAVKLPEDMQPVIFVDEYDQSYIGGFDNEEKYWWQEVVISAYGKIPQATALRWFPLPGSKGGEE